MVKKKIESPPSIYCLYHLRADCDCIRPVTDPAEVRPRIERVIRLNELNARWAKGEARQKLERENEGLRKRL